MRLLHVKTYELEDFLESEVPPYAILSHTWGQDEVSYQDIQRLRSAKKKAGFEKIAYTCEQAASDGLSWVWIDNCCIDKSSSAELQEAINSMYRRYADAEKCYAYLHDIHHKRLDHIWFTRGWPLQELIAPQDVTIYGSGWRFRGVRSDTNMLQMISSITTIDVSILNHSASLSSISIAKRMSWAANRRTSRTEDLAYCLLGLFGASMPMLYGEGARSFTRLQEEILRSTKDHSIFAWGLQALSESYDLLARSPSDFVGCHDVVF